MTKLRLLGAALAASVTFAACATPTDTADDSEDIAQATDELVTDCKYFDPTLYPPLAWPVVPDHELTITDLSVVEDPCRTTNAPTVLCPAGTVGEWTFATLMKEMAGATAVDRFVQEWLSTFETPQTVNGFPVNPRPFFRSQFLDPWLQASGCSAGDPIVGPGACSLDLKIAPFRLLAIVNREDLEGNTYGGGNPGEARFVFGWIQIDPFNPSRFDKNGRLLGFDLPATVIFEYKIPPKVDICGWGNRWHNLSNTPFGPAFNNDLASITNDFMRAGLDAGAPNFGNSIGQVRTNEIAFGFDWVLREYTLQDVGLGFNAFGLRNDTTKQTPDDSMNNDPGLNAWVIANEPDIMNVDHSVPNAFMGGESSETFFVWETSVVPPVDPLARHHFGFSTCNGCHTNEVGTPFTHIGNRPIGTPAPLSPFASTPVFPSTSNPRLPAVIHTISDPFNGKPRDYNEPWRRVCEAHRILFCEPKPYTRQNGGVH